MRSRNPVFIGGMFKSGTSLLRAMLGAHPRLFAGLETQWLAEKAQVQDIGERKAWLERLAIFFDVPRQKLEETAGGALDIETCLDRLLSVLARREGKFRWVEKTPYNAGSIDRILRQWPHAKVLHVLRDPRDVYASMVEMGKWSELSVFARHWCNTVGVARNWLTAAGGTHPGYRELRYEALVLAPEATMRSVLAFLGETWEPRLSMFDGRPQDFERVRQATGKVSTTLKRLAQPLNESRIGIWSSIIGEEGWAPVQAELARRGYGDIVQSLIGDTEMISAEAARTGCTGLVEQTP